jgi:hypothetical protein
MRLLSKSATRRAPSLSLRGCGCARRSEACGIRPGEGGGRGLEDVITLDANGIQLMYIHKYMNI